MKLTQQASQTWPVGQKPAIFARLLVRPRPIWQSDSLILPAALGNIAYPNFTVVAKDYKTRQFRDERSQGAVAARELYALWSFGEVDEVMGANSGNART